MDEPNLEDRNEQKGTLTLELEKPPLLEKICSGDILTDEESELYDAVRTLKGKTKRTIRKGSLEQCPLIYSCSDGRIVDANCLGDVMKFSGCHTFIRRATTSPPKGINYNSNVTLKLEKVKSEYENLKQQRIDKEKDIENAKKDYQNHLIKIEEFEKENEICF